MKHLSKILVFGAALAFSGCVFGALDGRVNDALANIDDTKLASAEQAADILDYNWTTDDGSADVTIKNGVMTITSEGKLGVSNRKTTATRSFVFEKIDEDGYARFKLNEGRMCVAGSKDCNRDVGGSATARIIIDEQSSRSILLLAQMNTIGDKGDIAFTQNSYYSGTGEFIVWAWMKR